MCESEEIEVLVTLRLDVPADSVDFLESDGGCAVLAEVLTKALGPVIQMPVGNGRVIPIRPLISDIAQESDGEGWDDAIKTLFGQ